MTNDLLLNLNKPLLSICCITYNHEKYINDAINGFLIQKTNFPIEILLHDDASTDNTSNIIKEYEKKFPEIIKCIYQKENLYSKGIRDITVHYLFPIAQGKYIALCEGDDYWIDPFKLQKQVDFLETNPEYSMCFTARNVVDSGGNFIREEHYPKKIYTTKDVVEGFIPATQTILMRNYKDLISFRGRFSSYSSGDRLVAYYCSLMGPIYYIDEVTACYRESGEGVWSSFDYWQKREKRFERFKKFYTILGIENNNLNLIDRGFYEFYSRVLANIKHPIKTIKDLKKFYKVYLYKSPIPLILVIIYFRFKKRILKLFMAK